MINFCFPTSSAVQVDEKEKQGIALATVNGKIITVKFLHLGFFKGTDGS